jgi:hypothetical protein
MILVSLTYNFVSLVMKIKDVLPARISIKLSIVNAQNYPKVALRLITWDSVSNTKTVIHLTQFACATPLSYTTKHINLQQVSSNYAFPTITSPATKHAIL